MAGVSFTLSLIDKLSSPAKASAASLDQLTTKAKGLSTQMGGLETSMGGATTGASGASSSMAGLGEGLAGAGAAATVAAAAIVAVGVAIAGAAVAAASFAISATEARDKLLATASALTGSASNGAAFIASLDGMRSKLGMTREELAPMAENLLKMGVQAKDVGVQLTAMASAKAIGGDAGANEYANILKKLSASAKLSTKDLTNLKDTGVNVNEIAAKMGVSVTALQTGLKNGTVSSKAFGAALQQAVTAKGAGVLAQQANSLTAQLGLAKDNITDLFTGANIGPFLTQLKSLFSIFDQGTDTGKALKITITGALNGIFTAATQALPYIKTGIEIIINYGLRAALALKPIITSFKEWLTTGGGLQTIWTTLKGIGIVLGIVGGAALVLGGLLISPFVAAGAAITVVGVALGWLVGKLSEFVPTAIKALSSFASAGATMASGFITGLVSGITGGIASAVSAVTNLGSSLLAAAKSLVPTFGGGAAAPGGAATGGPAPAAAKPNALGGLVTTVNGEGLASVAPGEHIVPAGGSLEMPAASKSAPSSASGGGASGGVNVGGIVINVGGGSSPQETATTVRDMLAEQVAVIFEKIGLSGGAAMA